MRKYLIYIVVMPFILCSCSAKKPKFTQAELEKIPLPQTTNLPAPSGGFVLKLGNGTLSSDEVIEVSLTNFSKLASTVDFAEFNTQARESLKNIITSQAANTLLYQKAKARLETTAPDDAIEKAVEAEVQDYIASFNGNSAKAGEDLEKSGMTWESFREYQKKLILSQVYVQQQLPEEKPVTYTELMNYYKKNQLSEFYAIGAIKIQLIDIQAEKVEIADANLSKEINAEMLGEELMAKLKQGEDFGTLAKQYSNGHRAMYDGIWEPVNPKALAEPYDILARYAEKLRPGEVSELIKTDGHIFIMKLIEKEDEGIRNFNDVKKQIETKIRGERRKKAVDQLSERIVKDAGLYQLDEFVDYCLEKIYYLSNS